MNIDTQEFEPAISECIRLFLANHTSNVTETVMRARALQELSQGVSTADLMALAFAVQQAGSAGAIIEALNDTLRKGPRIVAA